MGINQNMQTLLAYKAARALEEQLELQRREAGVATEPRKRHRVRDFLDRMLGIR